jgi:REP element-mobilizing transposase RayT
VIADDTFYYRAYLPHLQKLHKTYFVTFCTYRRFVLPPLARDIVLAHVGRAHGISYALHTAVVMPDHLHLIIAPYELVTLEKVLQLIKGASAFYVNQRLGRSGPLWQRESFDHILRSDESVCAKSDYLCANPVRAGLVQCAEEYPWIWLLGTGGLKPASTQKRG